MKIETAKKDDCMTCGISRRDMIETPWGRYVNNEMHIQCKPCRETELEEQISEFQNTEQDLDYTDDIICPYCGHCHDKDGETEAFYLDGDHEFSCSNCSNEFSVTTNVSISYSTTIRE